MGPQKGMHPPFSFVLPKENAPCTVEKKNALSKLAHAGKFGDADGCRPAFRRLARFHPSALYLGNHSTFKPQVVTWFFIPGCLLKRLASGPAAAPSGVFPKRGPQPPLLVVLRGGLEGESRNPPPMSLFDRARPFLSPRERWGRICPTPIGVVTSASRCGQADNRLSRQNNPPT